MKYHFRIINTTNQQVVEDSAEYRTEDNVTPFKGWELPDTAEVQGYNTLGDYSLPGDPVHSVEVYPVPENVTEEDILSGMVYPEEPLIDDCEPPTQFDEDKYWEQQLNQEIDEHLKDRGDIWKIE